MVAAVWDARGLVLGERGGCRMTPAALHAVCRRIVGCSSCHLSSHATPRSNRGRGQRRWSFVFLFVPASHRHLSPTSVFGGPVPAGVADGWIRGVRPSAKRWGEDVAVGASCTAGLHLRASLDIRRSSPQTFLQPGKPVRQEEQTACLG